jgi:hypothetical protein
MAAAASSIGIPLISREQLVTSPPTTDFFVDGGGW